jgi:hypothetical protein
MLNLKTLRYLLALVFAALCALAFGAAFRLVSAQQSPCYLPQHWQVDSLIAESQRRSPTTGAVLAPRGTVVRRLATRIDSIGLSCVTPPPATGPKPTLSLSLSDTVLRSRPTTPYIVFVTPSTDSAGVKGDVATFSVSDTTVASFYWLGQQKKLQVSNATKAGVVTITGRWGSATASVALRISPGSAPTTPPIDTTTPPGTPPPTGIKPPELPRAVASYPLALHALPCTDRPTTTASLQAVLNAGGSRVICLGMGLQLDGNWHVPARAATDTGWTVLRADSLFTRGRPVLGTERLPRLRLLARNQPVLHFRSRSARWLVQGVEITTDSSVATTSTNAIGYLVFVGEYIAERTLADLPRDIHFSHINTHGWPLQDVNRALALNGAGHAVLDSRCTEIHQRNSDSQCVVSWNGPGPFTVRQNVLEASAENIMFGGGDPGIPGLVPCDITVEHNVLRKPIAWKSVGTPTQSGSYNIKLLYESKNACRSLVQYNRMDGSWQDGQTGYAIGLKSVNQNGGCRWCRVTDQTIQYNTIVNVGAGFGFAGRPEHYRVNPPGFPVDTALSRVLVQHNWIDSLNVAPYNGDQRGILLGWEAHDIQFVRNTWAGGNYGREFLIFNLPPGPAVTGFRFDDNVMPVGVYGVGASGVGEGSRALAGAVAGTMSFQRNAFIGNPRANYPATTTWHASLAAALASGAGTPSRPVP